jgi:hypothetical protein
MSQNESSPDDLHPALLRVLSNLNILIQMKDSQDDLVAVEVLMWAREQLIQMKVDLDYIDKNPPLS